MSNPSGLPEIKQDRVLTSEDWNHKWENRNIGFHEENIHPLLAEFLKEMINGRTHLNIFFPFCGKAVDMKWLADLGHNIVGVDVSEIALKEFFEEHSIAYVEEEVTGIPEAKLFKSTSGNICLYCCNIYLLSDSVIGKFDGIWDRGALVAVNPRERERYVNVLLSLMNEDVRYLLVTVDYDPKLHAGPPFYVPKSEVEALFGSLCNFKQLKKVEVFTDKQKLWGLDFFFEDIYLLTRKSHS
ncbi:thiopurine S-methyltransferase isoform X2 [Pseudophryne corroboree]